MNLLLVAVVEPYPLMIWMLVETQRDHQEKIPPAKIHNHPSGFPLPHGYGNKPVPPTDFRYRFGPTLNKEAQTSLVR